RRASALNQTRLSAGSRRNSMGTSLAARATLHTIPHAISSNMNATRITTSSFRRHLTISANECCAGMGFVDQPLYSARKMPAVRMVLPSRQAHTSWRLVTILLSYTTHTQNCPCGLCSSRVERATAMVNDNTRLRHNMVTQQLIKRGIEDPRVLQAMRDTPRHRFVPARHRAMAYEDMPLAIGHEQTISQPLMVAMMTAALQLHGHERVLEI